MSDYINLVYVGFGEVIRCVRMSAIGHWLGTEVNYSTKCDLPCVTYLDEWYESRELKFKTRNKGIYDLICSALSAQRYSVRKPRFSCKAIDELAEIGKSIRTAMLIYKTLAARGEVSVKSYREACGKLGLKQGLHQGIVDRAIGLDVKAYQYAGICAELFINLMNVVYNTSNRYTGVGTKMDEKDGVKAKYVFDYALFYGNSDITKMINDILTAV